MVKRTLMLATVLLLSFTMGCTTVQRWMAGGAALGAGVGAAITCHHGSLSVAQGAGLGALGGATVGALVGDMLQQREIRADKARIAELEQENANLKSQLQQAQAALDAANRRIAELEAQLKNLPPTTNIAGEISLSADVLFRPGSARLSDEGRRRLDEAANTLMSQYRGKFIMIEGHTDAQPIRRSNWKSNWELGAARSLTVLHYLTDKGVDPAMLSAATFSKYQPRASNDTPDGMAQNRRAVIVIYSTWRKSTEIGGAAPATPATPPAGQ